MEKGGCGGEHVGEEVHAVSDLVDEGDALAPGFRLLGGLHEAGEDRGRVEEVGGAEEPLGVDELLGGAVVQHGGRGGGGRV